MTTGNSTAEPALDLETPKTEDPTPLRAMHTPNFPALLRQLGASRLVTTCQAGKLVLVRDEGAAPQHPLPRLPGADPRRT